MVGPTGLGSASADEPEYSGSGWREMIATPWGVREPSAAAITSAASPPSLAHYVFGADARVWLGRCAFRTDPRLSQIPSVAAFAPVAAASGLIGCTAQQRSLTSWILVAVFYDSRHKSSINKGMVAYIQRSTKYIWRLTLKFPD